MAQAREKGFGVSPDDVSVAEKIALLHTELSEAYEAYRHNNIDDKDGFREELGDILQRLLHLAGIFNIDLEHEALKKIDSNKNRIWDAHNMNERFATAPVLEYGKLFVIDGIDGSGKKTQLDLLQRRLIDMGYKVHIVDFPQYGHRSAALVEDYLNGSFGPHQSITPYQASIFYAVDRFSARDEMYQKLEEGYIILSNRYTTANEGHQGAKIDSPDEREKFLSWLDHLEFGIFSIPRPDLVLFVDVPPEIAQQLVLKKAEREYLDGKKQDVLEADIDHLTRSHLVFNWLSQARENWRRIECVDYGRLKSPEEIHQELWQIIEKTL